MNNKTVLTILKIGMVGCLAVGTYAYGRVQYWQGRIDVVEELKGELEKVKNELYEKYNLNKKEEA